jgi:anthranilate phosphoribosyltransferase
LFLEGQISGSDFLDLAETTGINIDLYSEEVEENLEEIGFL